MKRIFYILPLLFLSSCTERNQETNSINIVRLDKMLNNNETVPVSLLQPLLSVFSTQVGEEFTAEMYRNSSYFTIFEKDVTCNLPSLNEVEKDLSSICLNAERINIKIPIKNYCGIINPYNQPIIVTDSIVYIGLNHYLGSNYKGYDSFPDYIRKKKNISRMVYDIVESSLAYFNPYYNGSKSNVLSRIAYEGALAYIAIKIIPDCDIYSFIGYEKNEKEWINQNISMIWNTLIEKQLLFTSEYIVISKLCNPAPASNIICNECPAMIGKYIGYEIIKSYLSNNDVQDISRILISDFYNADDLLIKAKLQL